MLYLFDLGEKFVIFGGNVLINVGGMRVVKYGIIRDYVRVMIVVFLIGEIIKLGVIVLKISIGYSLLNLMIGLEGILGVIIELILKLIFVLKEIISLIIFYENLDECIVIVFKFFMNYL